MGQSDLGYRWVLCVFLITGLTGCVPINPSQPSRFYMLSPQAETGTSSETSSGEPLIAIGLGPVEIPEYINRVQIVTRLSANEIKLWEFDRWAEPLNESFTRCLSENLTRLLCCRDPRVVVFPRRIAVRVDYKVEVGVVRFDGELEKDVALVVLWGVFENGSDKPLVTRRSEYIEPVVETGHEALVAAESRAVLRLSRDIAEAFTSILHRQISRHEKKKRE